MSTMFVNFPGGKRVDCSFDGYVVHADQSKAHGGEGSAPEPFSIFLSSLATCAGIYVLGFCQARGIPTDGVGLRQESEFDSEGKLRDVHLTIELPPDFPEKYVGAVKAAAAGCKVKKALLAPPTVTVDTVIR